MFYVSGRLSGGRVSNGLKAAGGSAKEDPHVRGGRGGGVGELDLMNVSRTLAPGGSFCRVLQGSEALGGPGTNHA